MYRYTAARHIRTCRRNLHWLSLNVTILLNDRLRGAECAFPSIPRRRLLAEENAAIDIEFSSGTTVSF